MTTRVAGIEHARMQALGLLEKFGVESTEHLRIDAFARRLGVELVETPIDGARAQLVVGARRAHILLSQRLTDPAERRWSIAHELGHFVLGHPAPPAAELCLPRPRRRRRHCRHHEDEANGFAAALLFPDPIVASICDTRPMTLDAPEQLAELCCAPWLASAMRITEVTWRVCALVVSQHGVIRWISPSLPFLMLCAGRIWVGDPVGPGSLARRFFDTGVPCGAPDLVPVSAWLEGCGPEARIQEHSVGNSELGIVVTMLWDASESAAPRPPEATLRAMAICRDHLLGELEEDPTAVARILA
jgi:Zn-dependent peptidase ImmA (M78 family)